jgi:phospholipid/cholesterol/gamma-HCH transport system substrate-binding protein
MRGRRVQRLAANPTLVGALTVLIVIVAVFLAYNANKGLPFVPTYPVSVQVPDGDSLVKGNDVRVGGIRVGSVESVEPVQHKNGIATAKLNLKLDRSVEPLPADTTVAVRTRSALGLKYLEIRPGKSNRGLPAGSTLPLAAARPASVDIDRVLNMFDPPTRRAIQRNQLEFGSAIAGRGPDINATIAVLRPLLDRLEPVMRNLSSQSTGLGRFFKALEATASEVAPVAETQAHQYVSLDTTFTALARVARPFIQETISKSPPTEDATIRTSPRIRSFLRDSQALFTDFGPASRELIKFGPVLARLTRIGPPVLRKTPVLNAELPPTAKALVDFGNTPGVTPGLRLLTQTNNLLDPTLAFVTPAQSVCNYLTLLLRNGSSIVSLGNGIGHWQRFALLAPPGDNRTLGQSPGPNNIGSPASAPANGGGVPDTANHLHYNPYPNTASPGQPKECEAGNEPYKAGQTLIGNVPGNQGTETEGQLKPKASKKKSGGKS